MRSSFLGAWRLPSCSILADLPGPVDGGGAVFDNADNFTKFLRTYLDDAFIKKAYDPGPTRPVPKSYGRFHEAPAYSPVR
jgi:hypothetical protein